MVFKAMELTEISDAKAVLKIGDSAIDIEEGKNAGCGLTVGITTGAQTKEQIQVAEPDFIIDGLSELPSLLN
jgi:phosphoglycolate phosphatase-like HAD superfamily hydrolase